MKGSFEIQGKHRATDKLAIKICPRCGMMLLPDDRDIYCLACGYREYGTVGEIAEQMRWEHDLQQPNVRPLVKTATIQEWDL